MHVFLWKYYSMNMMDVLGPEGFQSYSGHPRISLFLLFSASSHSMRGLKYSMSGWALILGWPVIMVIASGQGLLNPSCITSLQTTQVGHRKVSSESVVHMVWSMFLSATKYNIDFFFLSFNVFKEYFSLNNVNCVLFCFPYVLVSAHMGV